MKCFQKSLASLLVILVSFSPVFSNNAVAEVPHAVEKNTGKEDKENVTASNWVFSNFPYPSTTFIVVSTASVGAFTAVASYFYLARGQRQANNGAQNAGIAIIGAVAQAALPHDGYVGQEEFYNDEQPSLLEVLVPVETSSVQEPNENKVNEETDNAVVEQDVKKPKRRTKAIAGSRELLETAQRFLGNQDYNAPRPSRLRGQRK